MDHTHYTHWAKEDGTNSNEEEASMCIITKILVYKSIIFDLFAPKATLIVTINF